MKDRFMVITIVCAFVLTMGLATFALAEHIVVIPGAGITGTAHDLAGWNGGTETRICAFCHTPHHALGSGTLWSRSPSDTAYAQYDSSTFDGTMTTQLAGPSGMCMSCHDGVIAVDSYYGATGTVGGVDNDDDFGGFAVGVDPLTNGLSNDHPIGFTYDTDLANDDGELHDPALGTTTFIGNASMLVSDALSGGVMTCATCHDVHNSSSVDQYFLYGTQTGSGICLSCHDK